MLELPWLSQKRLTLLAGTFVAEEAMPSVSGLGRREAFIVPKALLPCSILVNASVVQLLEAASSSPAAASPTWDGPETLPRGQGQAELSTDAPGPDPLAAALDLYAEEHYVLLPTRQGTGAESPLLARPQFVLAFKTSVDNAAKAQAVLQAVKFGELVQGRGDCQATGVAAAVIESLQYARTHVGQFRHELGAKGWDVEAVVMWSRQSFLIDCTPAITSKS